MSAAAQPERFVFRLTVPLPLTVNGGLTRWRIHKEHFDKGGKRVAIIADCIETGESITLVRGSTRFEEDKIATENISVEKSAKAYQIARKLVKDGRAERVKI